MKINQKKKVKNFLVHAALFSCACLSIFTTFAIVAVLVFESRGFFQQVSLVDFLTDTEWTPLFYNKHFGILPLVIGTALIAFIAISVALPLGLIIAIYLSEFSSKRVRKIVKPSLEILAGIPTVVYGYFALLFVTPLLQKLFPQLAGFNALSPGLVMGIMILPMVASLSEDAMRMVPDSLKEGAYALGSRKLQVIFRVLLPSAFGGIISSVILATSRAIGETMIVAIAAGQQARFNINPMQSVQTMTAYIVQVSLGDVPHGTLEYSTLFAVATALFVLTLFFNLISLFARKKFEKSFGGRS